MEGCIALAHPRWENSSPTTAQFHLSPTHRRTLQTYPKCCSASSPSPHPTKTPHLDHDAFQTICSHPPTAAQGSQQASPPDPEVPPLVSPRSRGSGLRSPSARGQKGRELLRRGRSTLQRLCQAQRQETRGPAWVELSAPQSFRNPGDLVSSTARGAPESLWAGRGSAVPQTGCPLSPGFVPSTR